MGGFVTDSHLSAVVDPILEVVDLQIPKSVDDRYRKSLVEDFNLIILEEWCNSGARSKTQSSCDWNRNDWEPADIAPHAMILIISEPPLEMFLDRMAVPVIPWNGFEWYPLQSNVF